MVRCHSAGDLELTTTYLVPPQLGILARSILIEFCTDLSSFNWGSMCSISNITNGTIANDPLLPSAQGLGDRFGIGTEGPWRGMQRSHIAIGNKSSVKHFRDFVLPPSQYLPLPPMPQVSMTYPLPATALNVNLYSRQIRSWGGDLTPV
jgi:hypothetical protein